LGKFQKPDPIDVVRYWNDIEQEKSKPYFLEDENDLKLIKFLQQETNLQKCFEASLEVGIKGLGFVKSRILEIGVGVAWTSALLSRIPDVEEIYGIDVSEHRLKNIAPIVFKQFGGDCSKFKPLCASFLEMELGHEQFDCVIFVQSLYMFSDITNVLRKVHQVLKPQGGVIVACEGITTAHALHSLAYLKQTCRRIVKGRADCSGNHFYNEREYQKALEKAGFQYYTQYLNYPVYKNSPSHNRNHFGSKNPG
jgi:ubiquinone/menaquinone biosynthesis C-methylase UbiE